MSSRTHSPRILVLLLAIGLVAAACGDDDDDGGAAAPETSAAPVTEATSAPVETTTAAPVDTTAPAATTTATEAPVETTEPEPAGPVELVGVFAIEQGECADAGVTNGSYFRMVAAEGTLADGPFVGNADSKCGDQTWNILIPGADGGLVTGDYQAQPEPPFDDTGSGTAGAITAPTPFFAAGFALATNATDPQTGSDVPAPSVVAAEDGTLSGDLSALGVAWSGQHFNQGSPKPDGSLPGISSELTGTFDPETGEFVLEWASQIVGGAFDGFTGVWHLEGTFEEA